MAKESGFNEIRKWNVAQVLSGSKGKAIRTPDGWELTNSGRAYLIGLGVPASGAPSISIAVDLRTHLSKLADQQTQKFVQEAITCHEAGCYRAAVVMSWLGAVDVLHKFVHKNHLAAFNSEATRVLGPKWKLALSTDDLGKMKEGDFLDRLEGLSIIGKNVKAELKTCLDRRNSCGHPNTFKLGANQSAAHLEILLLNVFEKFA
ncbi:hypothetical protein AB4Z25_05525 [Rhizobium sp. RAF36]